MQTRRTPLRTDRVDRIDVDVGIRVDSDDVLGGSDAVWVEAANQLDIGEDRLVVEEQCGRAVVLPDLGFHVAPGLANRVVRNCRRQG